VFTDQKHRRAPGFVLDDRVILLRSGQTSPHWL
jgi:hypothetical protein